MNFDYNPSDPFGFFRQMMQQNALQNPLGAAFTPAMSEEEVQRKISELKLIEGWLTMNVGLVSMQIKGYEMQLATLQAIKPKDIL